MKIRQRTRRHMAARLNPVSGAVALAVGSMAVLPATSTEAQGVGPRLPEEIVVTATRREKSVQDIPYNISAVSGGELRELQVTRIADLARWVPGMTLVDQGPRTSSPLIIRGVSVDDLTFSEAAGNSNGNTVATYVGEVPVYIDLVTKDLERVEILRGPQGTLFGANSLAGAVRYIPKRPSTEAFYTDAGASVSSIEESDDPSYDVDATVNIPITDKLAFRGLLSYEDRAGFIDQNYLVQQPGFSIPEPDFNNPAEVAANLRQAEDVNDVETWYARTSLLWEATDQLEFLLTYHYQDQDIGGRQTNNQDSLRLIAVDQGAVIPNGFYDNGQRVPEPNELENQIVEFVVTADLGFAELTSATGYVEFEDDGQRDQTDLLLTFGYTYADFPNFTAFTAEESTEETLTQELRLVSTGDGPFSWIGGFFYSDAESDTSSLEFTPCLYNTDPTCPPGGSGVPEIPQVVSQFGDDVEYIQLTNRELNEWALFGELSYQFTDQFQMTVGARYFDVEDEFDQAIGFPLLNQIFGIDPDDPDEQVWLNATGSNESFDDIILKLNTSYDVNEDTMVYFTFSEGYRNGGSNSIADCDDLPVLTSNVVCGNANQLAYEPDETDNYEIGVRNQFLDGQMTLNAALFYISWDKVQVGDVSESGGFPIIVNGDDAESRGLELEFAWQIDDNWGLRGSYSFTNAELGNDTDLLAEGTAEKGDRLPGTPRHQGTLFVNYNKALNADLELTVDYGLTAQSNVLTKLGRGGNCCRPFDGVTSFVNPGPGESLSGFDVHYATIALSGERWDARLYANNLWNKEQVTGVRADRSLVTRAGGVSDYAIRRYFNYVLTPREIGLDFRYRFNDLD